MLAEPPGSLQAEAQAGELKAQRVCSSQRSAGPEPPRGHSRQIPERVESGVESTTPGEGRKMRAGRQVENTSSP